MVVPQTPKKSKTPPPTNKQTSKQKKDCQSPHSVHTQSCRNCLSGSAARRRDLLLCRTSCCTSTREMQEPQAPRPCASFSPPRQDCESGAHCSWSCFTGCLISIKLPGLPVTQTDFMNTVLCVLGFIIPHVPPSQFCTR